ncbi:hypothetical protein BH09MYX1_BH09MYX1_03160 [soil metagenome]
MQMGQAQAAVGFEAGSANSPFGDYELNTAENEVVSATSKRAKLWGVIAIVIGVLHLMLGLGAIVKPGLAVYFVDGVIEIIVGSMFLGAASSFAAVVSTQGRDMPNMMKALLRLNTIFMIQIVVTGIGFMLGVLLVVVGVLLAASGAH